MLQQISPQEYFLEGNIDFYNVMQIAQQSKSFWQSKHIKTITIDFSKVNQAQTPAIALLLEWVRMAKQNAITLNFTHIPSQLLALIELSAVKNLLPIK